MKKLCLILFATSIFLISCNSKKDSVSFEAMNTYMTIQSYGKNSHEANLEIMNRMIDLEEKLSTTKDTSTIFRLNNSDEKKILADEDTLFLVDYAKSLYEKTDGALNIALYPIISAWGFTNGNYRIPEINEINSLLMHTDASKITISDDKIITLEPEMKIDLGAIGKGYAGDEAIKILKKNGIKSALLDLGGNIQTLGTKPDGNLWSIGIKNPWDGTAAAGIKIEDKAVITSGGYERYFIGEDGKKYIHIFDGKTGMPAENNIASVTIICDSGLYGDALSTSLFVMDLEKAEIFWKKNKNFDLIILTNNNEIHYTCGIEENLTLIHPFTKTTIIR